MNGRTFIGAMLLMAAHAAAAKAVIITGGGGLQWVQHAGTFDGGNIALGGTAFALNIEGQDGGTPTQPTGYGGVHTTTGINNGAYGNSGAWLAGSPNSYVGLNLNGSYNISSIAFGRDNLGAFIDRQTGLVTVQYTTDPTPSGGSDWNTIGTINFTAPAFTPYTAVRNRFNFNPVNATGIRLITANAGRGIDEFEVYASHYTNSLLGVGNSIVIDEQGHTNAVLAGAPIPAETGVGGNGAYRYANSPASIFFRPEIVGSNVTVEASWGVSFNHTRQFNIYFDPDGTGQNEVLLASNLNQTLLADQTTTPDGAAWSGFREIANGLDLQIGSVFRLQGFAVGDFPYAVSTAAWQFTSVVPEPSSALAIGLASVSLLTLRRRARNEIK